MTLYPQTFPTHGCGLVDREKMEVLILSGWMDHPLTLQTGLQENLAMKLMRIVC